MRAGNGLVMRWFRGLWVRGVWLAAIVAGSSAMGAAGTSQIAWEGHPVAEERARQKVWPTGVLAVVNDPCRTLGVWPWFTECPNDVEQYVLVPASTEELQRVLTAFAQIEGSKRVELHPGDRVRRIGFGMDIDEDMRAAAVFSIGSQPVMDAWFDRLEGGKWGVHQYDAPPKAQPPTLALYVGHELLGLESLRLSPEWEVRPGFRVMKEDEDAVHTSEQRAILDYIKDHETGRGLVLAE
ncbi:MAG: hypothetical protein AAF288_04585 [Planctomycetota bacterium]